MQDFNSYSKTEKVEKNKNPNNADLIAMITKIAQNYDGKSEDELLKAIYIEAEKSRKKGTLTDDDIDKFVMFLTPMLDDKKRKKLYDLAEKLKRKKIN